MKIILIIILFSGNYSTRNGHVHHVEFDSMDACSAARAAVLIADEKSTTTTISANCFPKG